MTIETLFQYEKIPAPHLDAGTHRI